MEKLDTLEQLAARAQEGDQQAYVQFLNGITPYVRSAVRSKLGSLVDQEDVTQDCLMGIHKNLASYHPSQPIKPWVSAIIRYKLADYFRKMSRRKEQYLGDEALDVTDDGAQANEKVEKSQGEVAQVLGQLPEKLRRAIELTHINGLSYPHAAEKEGVSEAALRKRISRGFSQIRKMVAKEMEI